MAKESRHKGQARNDDADIVLDGAVYSSKFVGKTYQMLIINGSTPT